MFYQVYHAKNPTFGLGGEFKFPDDFVLVAEVRAASVDDVFHLTNNIDREWRENDGVTLIAEWPIRSTSVGDIVVAEANSRVQLVMPIGWKDCGHEDESPITIPGTIYLHAGGAGIGK
jgi:hypothetical protein